VSIAGAHCTVFFWIGVLKTVSPLAACARPVLRMAMALNLLGAPADRKQQTTHTAVAAKSTKFFFSFTHQALELIPVVAEFRTLTCSQASPEIRSQQACVLRVYVCVLYYSSVEEGSS
jgi:hypothetical protein